MATKEQLKHFRASYNNCNQHPGFIDTFHNLFISTSAEAQQHFSRISVERQKKMLSYALYLLVLAIDDNPEVVKCLENLGDSHDKIKIKPALYDHWLKTLIATVKICDKTHDEMTGDIWKEVLKPGLDIMKTKYTA